MSDLALDFTVEADFFGRKIREELVSFGSEKEVTNENKLQYVHLKADWHVNILAGRPAKAFTSGLCQIIPIGWLRLFSPNELNALLNGGDGIDIDIDDLRQYTVYSGGYTDSSSTVISFWNEVKSFTTEEKALLLKFTTSCSRPPLGTFLILITNI